VNTRIEGNVIRDNTKYYFMFLNTGSDSMKVDFTLNPDGFYFGKLRSIEIDLIQDTSETRKAEVEDATKTNRFRVFATTKKRIDNIYDYFKEYYGRPDNSIQKHKETGISYMSAFGINYPDSIKITTTIWKMDEFQILFERDNAKKIPGMDGQFYLTANIEYRVEEYEQILTSLKDSLRKKLTPEDVIELNRWSVPEFENVSGNRFQRRIITS